MKRLLIIAALLAPFVGHAQTSSVRWQLSDLAGVAIPGVAPTTTQALCDAAARARNLTASYTCPRILAVTGTAPPPPTCTTPQPAAQTQSVACPAGTTGSWTQTRTFSAAAYPTCWTAGAWTPSAAPAGACVTPPPPPPPPPPPVGLGPSLYFSALGNNANPGTEASPKRDFSGINFNGLAAGTTLYLKRGDSFSVGYVGLENPNANPQAPITFAAYGTGAAPVWSATSGNGVEIGRHRTGTQTGPYIFKGIKFDGRGVAQWGFFTRGHRGLVLEDSEITGFAIGIHSQNMQRSIINDGMVLRNVTISRNREMGLLGDGDNLLIENSLFDANNFSGSNFNHAIYLGGYGRNGIIRNTRFTNNSNVNGRCLGGNLTVHGQWDGLLIEGNTITHTNAADSCYGIVVNGGYSSLEWFRNLIVRGNTVQNVGGCAICLGSTTGALIESNKLINDNPTYQTGVLAPSSTYEGGDDVDTGGIVRDNIVCHAAPAAGSVAVRVPPNFTVTGTVYQTGAAASTGACAR